MTDKNRIFSVKDIHVTVAGKEVVKGVSLDIAPGEIHALMGPNGSGKSSLANALSGHPDYQITGGGAYLDGKNILDLSATERSLAGLFLGFQYPPAIPGVTVANFMRAALKARYGKDSPALRNFRKTLLAKFDSLEISHSFATRYINDGFSGGEKKRLEILQMSMLQPRMAILDETDSGLDIDALKIVSNGINNCADETNGILLVTHYQRLLNYIKPNRVHVMMQGQIARTGGPELALELEERGYDWLSEQHVVKAGV